MNLEQQEDYIKQLEGENISLKKKIEDRGYIDRFDEIQMRKLWFMTIEKTMTKRDYVMDNLPTVANYIVAAYEKRFVKK
jgi:hypothetical protein